MFDGSGALQPVTTLRLGTVMVNIVSLTGPDTVPIALHGSLPPDRSKDMTPLNASAVATPLMAPFQSPLELIQAPSTQYVACATVIVIVFETEFRDSSVPVHVPATFANGPVGTGTPGIGLIGEAAAPPQALAAQATTAAPIKMKWRRGTDDSISTGGSHSHGWPAVHLAEAPSRCMRPISGACWIDCAPW
jgi:hypothetical protein